MSLPDRSNGPAQRVRLLATCATAVALFMSHPTLATAEQQDPHAHHMHPMPPKAAWIKSSVSYKIPELTLVRADGAKVSLPRELDADGKPVILNFIYTTCTAICPVMTQTFAEIQNRLGDDKAKVRMISVSIDPEQDTPPRLREYARKYSAGPQWRFYTGTVEASIATQKAFDAYRGDKMNHLPVTFLRAAPGKPWVRLEGFAPPDEVMKEIRQLVASR
jgi:protein SCO1/2